jgi:lantibiotic transport system permease protein
MTALLRALSAEFLKTKRTLAFWMTLVTPAVICILQLLMVLRQAQYGSQPEDAWTASAQNIYALWAILALPLFITLETALLAQAEHGEKHWKHLFALPIPRWAIYAAKWLIGALLLLLGQVFLGALIVATGFAAGWINPATGFSPTPPLAAIAKTLGNLYLIALLMHSIHTWVSLHFRSFTVAVGVGMAAAVSNIILMSAEEGPRYFPWALTVNALPQMETAQLGYAVTVSVMGALLLAFLGGWEVTRRDIL